MADQGAIFLEYRHGIAMDHLRVKTVELQPHIRRIHCREKIRRLSVIVQEIPRSGLRAERFNHQRDFRRRQSAPPRPEWPQSRAGHRYNAAVGH